MKTFVIGDTQITADTDLDVIKAAGNYIVEEQPEEIVMIGDWFDLESLSMYASAQEQEGRRLAYDIAAGVKGMDLLMSPLMTLQAKQKNGKRKVYKPKLVFTMGNHEERLRKFISNNPRLEGILPDLTFILEHYGWDVYPFLEVYVGLNNVHYMHYIANPMTGKPLGGSMDSKLNKVTYSFVHGHQQQYQYAERQQAIGNPQFGICVGAFYTHNEKYKGPQGNTHSRGTVILHHHDKGSDAEYISCERIVSNYLD